jgi:cyclase
VRAKRVGYSERELSDTLIRFEGRHPFGIGVTAIAIVSQGEAAVFDTLMFPADSHRMARSLQQRGLRLKVLINSHFHLDHTAGNQFFSERILAHRLCRTLMKRDLLEMRKWAKEYWSDRYGSFDPKLPNEGFDRRVTLKVGQESLTVVHTPGHSPDSTVVLVKGARSVLTGDSETEVPLFVAGDSGDYLRSLRSIRKMDVDFVVQGHGAVARPTKVQLDIDYLSRCRAAVREAGPSGTAQKQVVARPLSEFVGEKRANELPRIWSQIHAVNLQKISAEYTQSKGKS